MPLFTKIKSMQINNLRNSNHSKAEQHPFHLVNPSPWPLFIGLFLLLSLFLCVMYLHDDIHTSPCRYSKYFYFTSLACFFLTILSWFNDIILEATFQGYHTIKV